MASSKVYQIVILALVVLLVGTLGVGASYYQNEVNQVNSDNNQISQLKAPDLLADFKWSSGCFFGCSSSVVGEIANLGTITALSASVAFTFYSGNNYTGQVVCTTTYIIGELAGRSMISMPSITCSSSAQALSLQYAFSYAS